MKDYPLEVVQALSARNLVARDFVWFVARDRDTGAPVTEGLWSDRGKTTINVVDPETGLSQSRQFFGVGTMVKISDIPQVANLTVQQVTITMSQLDARAINLVRVYDCKLAKVQIFRGMYDPTTRSLVAPPRSRFVGFVDGAPITTPAENSDGGQIQITCTSSTQELARANSDTRSHESQKRRHAGDTFFRDVAVVGEQEFFWGSVSGKVHHRKRPRRTVHINA